MDKGHLEKQIWALEAYANAARVLTHARNTQELTVGVCEGITRQFPYVISWVGIAEDDPDKTVRVAGIAGPAVAYAQDIRVSWDADRANGQGPTGQAIRTGKVQVMKDAETDPNFLPWRERARQHGIRSSVAIPLVGSDRVIGALMVYASVPDAFASTELHLFQSLADEIGYGLTALESRTQLESERKEHEATQQKLLASLEMTIAAMATTMEMRDPYTSGHQRRVARIAEAIANKLGLDAQHTHGLKLAALIHDIGKVSIPSELLTKPTRLTTLEYLLIKEHVNNGYAILKDIPFIWPIAEIVRQHHERIDGSGYPLGLSGEQILLEAKILAVADIIESMSSHRPYRPALGLEAAMVEIRSRAGKDLDKSVVMTACELFHQNELSGLLV